MLEHSIKYSLEYSVSKLLDSGSPSYKRSLVVSLFGDSPPLSGSFANYRYLYIAQLANDGEG